MTSDCDLFNQNIKAKLSNLEDQLCFFRIIIHNKKVINSKINIIKNKPKAYFKALGLIIK